MSHHIPDDLLIEILARLPVKSLLRFRVICKHLHSIITNPCFITKHLNCFGKTSSHQLLAKMFFSEKGDGLILTNDEFLGDNYVESNFPSEDDVQDSLHIVGSCNGLICLDDSYFCSNVSQNIIIWNPCIRKSVSLPPRENPPMARVVIGFGFGLVTNMFKVVRIVHNEENEYRIQLPPEVEVHDQGGREWRPIGSAPPDYNKVWLDYSSQVFFHGQVHWVGWNRYTFENIIVAFDIEDEVFKEMALPPDLPTCCDCRRLSISVFKDTITVFGGNYGRTSHFISQIDECHVWMMKDYGVFESWTNLYQIVLPIVMNRPLGLSKNGKILFASTQIKILSFDPDTGTFTKSCIKGAVASSTVLNFVESLVLLT